MKPDPSATAARLPLARRRHLPALDGLPDVVIHQTTTYDWGTREEQLDGYGRLLESVAGEGADLVFVTPPPIRPDDFYEPHMGGLERVPEVAREVAGDSSGQATVLDATDVWGEEYLQEREGTPDRNPDGIHTCPRGAARFTAWLLVELAELHPPARPFGCRSSPVPVPHTSAQVPLPPSPATASRKARSACIAGSV
jgi:hypothetical protein